MMYIQKMFYRFIPLGIGFRSTVWYCVCGLIHFS